MKWFQFILEMKVASVDQTLTHWPGALEGASDELDEESRSISHFFPVERDKYGRVSVWRAWREMVGEHVIPRSKGGETRWENVVLADKAINNFGGNRTLKEAGLMLRVKPFASKAKPFNETVRSSLAFPEWGFFVKGSSYILRGARVFETDSRHWPPPDMPESHSYFLYAPVVNRRQYAVVAGFYCFRLCRL
jgi:hypothetical protein